MTLYQIGQGSRHRRPGVMSRYLRPYRGRHQRPSPLSEWIREVGHRVGRDVDVRPVDDSQWAQAFFTACTVVGLVSIVFGVVEMALGQESLARFDIISGLAIWCVPALILGIYWRQPSLDERWHG